MSANEIMEIVPKPSLERLRGTQVGNRLRFDGQVTNSWLRKQVVSPNHSMRGGVECLSVLLSIQIREIQRLCEVSASNPGDTHSQEAFNIAVEKLKEAVADNRVPPLKPLLSIASRYWADNINDEEKRRTIAALKGCNTVVRRALDGGVSVHALQSFFVRIFTVPTAILRCR